jgi:hypothetical protein
MIQYEIHLQQLKLVVYPCHGEYENIRTGKFVNAH